MHWEGRGGEKRTQTDSTPWVFSDEVARGEWNQSV